MKIRPTTKDDIDDLKSVLDLTGLFPSEMLPTMISGFLFNEDSGDVWLTSELEGKAIGFCYAVQEDLTDGAWNMVAIAVSPAKQGSGAGSALVKTLESILSEQKQRILIADTSGTDEFTQTRKFYQSNHYVEEARIRDFWAKGDDKVTFWKSLK